MYEGYREVPNFPVPFAPFDLDNQRSTDLWQCPLCGVEMYRRFGLAPTICPGCGQNPKRDYSDWGERREHA